ncbi:MAG: chemotaxis protein, partial [Gammaproteobacteria bacterium]|nr:chemotaxis protein [Gammaproteobacteria bacterium]
HQASNATDQVTASIQTVREAASESGTAADELLTASREIAERSNSMKSSIDGFLTNIRSL